jgi:hypothetical protein
MGLRNGWGSKRILSNTFKRRIEYLKKQSHSLLKVADHDKVSKEENEDPPIGGRNRRSS